MDCCCKKVPEFSTEQVARANRDEILHVDIDDDDDDDKLLVSNPKFDAGVDDVSF